MKAENKFKERLKENYDASVTEHNVQTVIVNNGGMNKSRLESILVVVK